MSSSSSSTECSMNPCPCKNLCNECKHDLLTMDPSEVDDSPYQHYCCRAWFDGDKDEDADVCCQPWFRCRWASCSEFVPWCMRNNHLITHTGYHPFECVCGVQFQHKHRFNKHRKSCSMMKSEEDGLSSHHVTPAAAPGDGMGSQDEQAGSKAQSGGSTGEASGVIGGIKIED